MTNERKTHHYPHSSGSMTSLKTTDDRYLSRSSEETKNLRLDNTRSQPVDINDHSQMRHLSDCHSWIICILRQTSSASEHVKLANIRTTDTAIGIGRICYSIGGLKTADARSYSEIFNYIYVFIYSRREGMGSY